MDLNRRRFLPTPVASLAAGVAVSRSLVPAAAGENAADRPLLNGPAPGETRQGDMIYRPLGRTGATVSLIGIGGSRLSKPPDEAEAIRIGRTAVDRGVNCMDNSWDYCNGKSEERMGKARLDGYRDKVFLATKSDGRTRAAAQQIVMDQSRVAAARGEFEPYKSSNPFDGTAQHPQWLGYDQKS